MISVVLPTYNGAKYIEQSIKSILNQTYSDWELIVVDDCSSDNKKKIVEKYVEIDDRIKLVHNCINRKLPASLNIGFELAKGEYFTWTSDDNAYAVDAFEKMKNAMVENDVDFVFADYDIIDQDDYILFDVKTGPIEEIVLNNVIGACFLYKRNIHNELKGYNTKRFLVEDYDFWLRVYWNYKMYHIEEKLYFYRIHRRSLTAIKKKEIIRAKKDLLKDNLKFIKDESMRQRVKSKIENNI